MIHPDEITQLIQTALAPQAPDTQVAVIDKTGMSDHFIVNVLSSAFADKNPLDRHRMVYSALEPALKDGRLHAVEIRTELLPTI